MQEVQAIDAHVAGAPVRLLTGGMPRPAGATMARRRAWFERQCRTIRGALMLEPRGHRDLVGAVLTEPETPSADAGLLFMDAGGCPMFSGAAVMAAATIALERGLITTGTDGPATLRFDTPAGLVSVQARRDATGRVEAVELCGVPSFAGLAGHEVRVGARHLRVDLAYGGLFYAVVDSEAMGIPLTIDRLADLRRLGAEIWSVIDGADVARHPAGAAFSGLGGVIFTAPPQRGSAHLTAVTVGPGGGLDRSPNATGMSAMMAVLAAMGLLQEGDPFVLDSVLGTEHTGHIAQRTQVGDAPAVVTAITGRAWVTGTHTFLTDDEDPFRDGYTL